MSGEKEKAVSRLPECEEIAYYIYALLIPYIHDTSMNSVYFSLMTVREFSVAQPYDFFTHLL